MNARRAEFYKTLGRWWQMAAMEGYDWGQPDTPETLQAEESLWESKELYENGEIKLSEVRPVFETWVKTHQKLKQETTEVLDAMRTQRRQEARA
jgi:hypothetical protein